MGHRLYGSDQRWSEPYPLMKVNQGTVTRCANVMVPSFNRAEVSCSEFISDKDRIQSQVLASCRCVDNIIPVHLGDFARDCQV